MPKLKVKKGDPVVTDISETLKPRDPLLNDVSLRDDISVMLANNVGPKEAGKYLGTIAFKLGELDGEGALKNPDAAYNKARKVIDKVVLYNQSPNSTSSDPKTKIGTFFDIHSKSDDIGDVISKLKKIGYGVESNYTDSGRVGLGRFPREQLPASENNNVAVTDIVTDRINAAKTSPKLRIKK